VLGNPTGFHLTARQAHDLDGADVLLPMIEADTVIADKDFDADECVIDPLEKAGKTLSPCFLRASWGFSL
jgi:hypothetical protein